MKKILVAVLCLFSLVSCFNNGSDGNGGKTYPLKEKEYPQEVIDYMQQFNIVENFDSTEVVKLNIKVFQTIGTDEGLAHMCSNKQYGWYHGDLIYYADFSNDAMVYDEKIIKEDALFLGTYTYTTTQDTQKTVPVYVAKKNIPAILRFISVYKDIKERY